jgi:hypothetical protein
MLAMTSDLSSLRAIWRDPVALSGLAVNLLPLAGVLVWGWDAAALVLFYWLENVMIGAITALRIILASAGRSGWTGAIGGTVNAGMFAIHYGLFCFVHGALLLEVFGGADGGSRLDADTIGGVVADLISDVLGHGLHMGWVFALTAGWYAFVFVRDFVLSGEWRRTDPKEEMFAPYPRVLVMHVAVFVIAGALEFVGDPGMGAAALVLARAAWGLRQNLRRTPVEPVGPGAGVAQPV